MAFYKLRSVGYGVAQQLGNVQGYIGGDYRGIRETTYGSVKFLGDVNAVGNISLSRINSRAASRLSGFALRAGTINTGVPQLDEALRRIISERSGRLAQAVRGDITTGRNTSNVTPAEKTKVQSFFVIDTSVFENFMNSDKMQQILDKASNDIIDEIQNTAPKDSNEYATSFRLEKSRYGIGNIVFTEDPKALHLEYGTRYMEARAPIRRAIQAVQRRNRIA